jgi:hypothetical protein
LQPRSRRCRPVTGSRVAISSSCESSSSHPGSRPGRSTRS